MLALSLLTLGLACGADPAPAPRPKSITPVGGVVKVDPLADPVWNEVTADPILTVLESPAKSRWVVVDGGCKVAPAGDGKTATFAAAKSGRYRLVVLPETGEPVLVAVLVGKVDPPPPKPDEPPAPPPPVPVSDLGKRLQVAFDLEPLPREKKLPILALKIELYKQAADLAADPAVTSTGQLVQRVRDAAKTLGGDALADLRKVIGAELAVAMPTDEPMTDVVRAKAAAAFYRIRSSLLEVK